MYHGMCVEVRGPLEGLGSFFPPCGSQGETQAGELGGRSLLLAEPPHWLSVILLIRYNIKDKLG